MVEWFTTADYALAYVIREEIYYHEGPGSPHESTRFQEWDGRHFLTTAIASAPLRASNAKVLEKFPALEPFMKMKMLELWEKLPTLPNCTAEYKIDDELVIYKIDGKRVVDICNDYLRSN